MPDWKDAAAVRGVELTAAQAEKLAALDRKLSLMMAMVDWKEEPMDVVTMPEIPVEEDPR
ncbi:MAG: hypothetical protein M9913_11245 [Bryobacteraceae bacterium]|nr:hypothetical protein [Solibacteraceae bacterium]MCL4841473.1 hypothetical protein [Bryobacteraceae bacterium]MCO5351453.1 hypothetical protein [Bryobacteraceae bacterium]